MEDSQPVIRLGSIESDDLALVQRLHALARDVPSNYPVTLTAGELRALLQSIGQAAAPLPAVAPCVRLARGESQKKMAEYLAGFPNGLRERQIVHGTGLAQPTVHRLLEESGLFERDQLDRYIWRLRTVQPLPLSPSSSRSPQT